MGVVGGCNDLGVVRGGNDGELWLVESDGEGWRGAVTVSATNENLSHIKCKTRGDGKKLKRYKAE